MLTFIIHDHVRFNMVSYSPQSRRLAVGAKNGQLALYDLRSSRCQVSYENQRKLNEICVYYKARKDNPF